MGSGNVFAPIASSYDRLNDLLSLGLHRLWKARLARAVVIHKDLAGRPILDVATGTGDVARLLQAGGLASQRAGPRGRRVLGLDPCWEMLQAAKPRQGAIYRAVLARSESIPLKRASVGAITSAFGVRNFDDRARAFREWFRVLVPGGVAGILEIHPIPPVWYATILRFYWRYLVPWIGRLWGRQDAYRYLRDSSQAFVSPELLAAEAQEAGFRLVRSVSMIAEGMVVLLLLERPREGSDHGPDGDGS